MKLFFNPQLTDMARDIQSVHDALLGERAIKGHMGKVLIGQGAKRVGRYNDQIGSGDYLPVLSRVMPETYAETVRLATWTHYTSDTLLDMVSRVFRLPLRVNIPSSLMDILEHFRIDLTDLAMRVFVQVAGHGRVVCLVNASAPEPIQLFPTWDCVNWGQVMGSDEQFAVFRQCSLAANPDSLEQQEHEQYLVLTQPLSSPTEPIAVKTFMSSGEDEFFASPDEVSIPPTSQPLSCLPITPEGIQWSPTSLPLLGITRLNIRHYRLTAALDYKLYAGQNVLKLLAGEGVAEKFIDLEKDAILTTPQSDAQLIFAEERGHMTSRLADTIRQVEELLRSMGAISYVDTKKGADSVEAVMGHQRAISVRIHAILNGCAPAMRHLLKMLGESYGLEVSADDIDFDYNRNLIDIPLSPEEIRANLEMLEAGTITQDQLVEILLEGDRLPPKIS